MKKVLLDFVSKDFFKFLLVGGLAAGVNFLSRILLNNFFSFLISIIIAYIIGMIVAFFLNRIFVFKPRRNNISKQFAYFTLINVLAVIQTVIVSLFFADFLFPKINIVSYREEIAHLIGISVPIFTSFLGHKYITFSKKIMFRTK